MEKSIKKYWPIFVLPTFAAFIIGFIVPFIEGIYLSFCKFTTIRDASFVGLSNYVEAFKDNTFTHAFGFTAVFAVVTLVLINVLAFAIALALTQKIKGTNIFRTIFFMPNLIGGIVLGYIWQLIFDGIFEKFDLALKLSAKLGFWGLVILICWQQIGYMMIVYIAGLQAIPGSLNEAAMIDGANKWARFRNITIPMLSPTLFFVLINTIISSFQVFDQAFVMTKGGPVKASYTLVYHIYQSAFVEFKMGRACAASMILFVIILAITMVQMYGSKRWVNYEQ